ncbi:RNA methyltransferase, TrmH family protein [Cryptosporidium muris RN66]|uniref:RNA methyltransferase, TrmH family protein n=1 Tax=Cryptosporidium muris (strain RN66) TaxID=441375 RepID=B6AE49_CRYMR|nr:RNA methyltransferase, TrmH family protein [Cryptosporidium muris RN66]EEA06490.1 RNA methyltransferase, TrmH family protein [Cryptosporidium muris RN66]|eukprot:XP_002140839.1 RNA methyltransferase, TrmH family protein [Cryptosporidium muris RN66]
MSNMDNKKSEDFKFYLILMNISKRQNFGALLRSACGFGVSEVLAVGKRKLRTFGNKGTLPYISLTYYDTLEEVVEIVHAEEMDIVGIEINENSLPVYPHPFRRSTAFILGNEGTGLSQRQIDICDYLVYIPMYGSGTASLNVAIAGSILFHHFALWAKFDESHRTGQKYTLGEYLDKKSGQYIHGKLRHYLNPSPFGKF